MNVLILEPYLAGSHAAWAVELAQRSRHEVRIMGLEGRHWKWRMHGGAVTLAGRYLSDGPAADLILASDMLDLSTFLAATRARTADLKTAVYFHENQLSYPWPGDDPIRPPGGRDAHYGFINYTSALAADAVVFNSRYHLESFDAELAPFLMSFPDHRNLDHRNLGEACCEGDREGHHRETRHGHAHGPNHADDQRGRPRPGAYRRGGHGSAGPDRRRPVGGRCGAVGAGTPTQGRRGSGRRRAGR